MLIKFNVVFVLVNVVNVVKIAVKDAQTIFNNAVAKDVANLVVNVLEIFVNFYAVDVNAVKNVTAVKTLAVKSLEKDYFSLFGYFLLFHFFIFGFLF